MPLHFSEASPFFVHGMLITDQAAASNVGPEHQLPRIGKKNKITRRWAKRAIRPSATRDQRTKSAYIFGAICPKPGKAGGAGHALGSDTHAMTQHPAEIARHVNDDAHVILIMDQAGWYLSNTLAVPENITIPPLPPKSPELNPVEILWHFMHGNWLSNRSSNPKPTSPIIAAMPGESSKANLATSCPSDVENGRMGSDQ